MPIVGWLNPYANTLHRLYDYKGMEKVMPREALDLIKRKEEEDEGHKGTNLTVTSGLGCPRKLAITRFLEYWPNPQRLWPPMMGTLLHEVFAKEVKGQKGWVVEVNGGREKCKVKGKLFGLEMEGRMDARFEDDRAVTLEIKDYKFSTSGADKFIDSDWKAKPEHEAQLNMLRMLLVQMGNRVSEGVRMVAWVVGGSWVPTLASMRDELAVGLTPVYGSKWTVRELFEQVVEIFEKAKTPFCSISKEIGKMPLVGKSMMRNKRGGSMCDYCAVRRECIGLGGWEEENVVPFIREKKVVEL